MNREMPLIRTTPWTLGLILLALLLALQSTSLPQRLDAWLYDTTITRFPPPVADDVALVAIDEASLRQLGRWPWPRSLHAELIRQLSRAGVRTVVFDVLFTDPAPDDAALAAAMAQSGNVVLPIYLAPVRAGQLMEEQRPAPALAEAAAGLGHAHVELDSDGVARGLYQYNGLGRQLWPSLALAASGAQPRQQPDNGLPPYVNVREDYRRVPLAGGAGTLPTYSYVDVLNGGLPANAVAGKTVFVGATAAGFGDVLPTPFSGLSRPLSGVEFHANVYSAGQQHLLIRPAPGWLQAVLCLMALLLISLLLPRMRPARTLLACLSVAGLVAAISMVALLFARVWLPAANALLIPLLAFPVATGLRLAMTNRFLNRQLDELSRRPQISLPEPGQRHPTQLLSQLRALLQPERWLLMAGSDLLSGHGLGPQDVPESLIDGQWIHQGELSWIRLNRSGQSFVLGLAVAGEFSREAVQRYLQRLDLNTRSAEADGHSVRENISARIERLRTATARLDQMQRFIRRSFERMPDGVIVTDELGVIRFANGHIEEWFEEPMPSLNGLSLARLLQGHDPRETPPWHETVSDTLTLQQSRTVDLRIRDKDFLIHFAPFSLPDASQNGIIANISDISELREQQRQHREAIDFISHDVRSPLVSQLALIEQLKRDPAHIEPAQLEQLGRLARRSYHLAEEFVQLARAEQLTETRFYECEFLAIVENARDSVSEQAAEKQIHLQLQGCEDLWLRGNAELLERAIINLLTNAVQYSPGGSTVEVQVFRAGHLACLTITDEGSGIDPEELPHLFDRYRRQKRSEISGIHGTGLGLSFVRTVVEKHKGEIAVSSEVGEGTSFTLKLPIADPIGG